MGILHNIILLHGGDGGLKLLPSPCVLAVLRCMGDRSILSPFVAKLLVTVPHASALLARPFAAEKTGGFDDAYVIESVCATQMTSAPRRSSRLGQHLTRDYVDEETPPGAGWPQACWWECRAACTGGAASWSTVLGSTNTLALI